MTTDLEPPRVPPLSAAERARLRNQLMERTRSTTRHPARHWVAPLVGVAAVVATVAGTLVITNRPAADTGVAAAETPAVARAGLEVVPEAEATATFAKSCEPRMHVKLERPLTILWARRVPGGDPNTDLVMIVRGAGTSGIASCAVPGGAGMFVKDPSIRLPSQQEGLLGVLSSSAVLSSAPGSVQKPVSQMWTVYRANPEIARIESRMVWKGAASPWQPGWVDDGYAYAYSRLDAAVDLGIVRQQQQVRAYDAQGRLLQIKPR